MVNWTVTSTSIHILWLQFSHLRKVLGTLKNSSACTDFFKTEPFPTKDVSLEVKRPFHSNYSHHGIKRNHFPKKNEKTLKKKKRRGEQLGTEEQSGVMLVLWGLAGCLGSRALTAGWRLHPVVSLSTWTEMEVLGCNPGLAHSQVRVVQYFCFEHICPHFPFALLAH